MTDNLEKIKSLKTNFDEQDAKHLWAAKMKELWSTITAVSTLLFIVAFLVFPKAMDYIFLELLAVTLMSLYWKIRHHLCSKKLIVISTELVQLYKEESKNLVENLQGSISETRSERSGILH